MLVTPYDRIADWYDNIVRTSWGNHEDELPLLFELMGDIDDKDVCDLGCGQGSITRRLAQAGARVVGIDMSERLLEVARQDEEAEPLGIRYIHDDAHHLDTLPDRSFDGVVSTWSLIDIEDLDGCLKAVARLLRPSGWLVFSITHPCFLGPLARRVGDDWLVGSYLKEGFWRNDYPEGVRGKVGTYHRTLSTYINTLAEAGLLIERVVEPRRPHSDNPRLPDDEKVPAFLWARCKKL